MLTAELNKDRGLRTAPGWRESDLVAAAKDGSETAFEVIMRRNNQLLFRTARAILRDDSEAEEAVQEAYIKAFTKLSAFAGKSSLSTWLVRIAVNEALSRRRGSRMQQSMDDIEDLPEPPLDSGLGQRDTPESVAARGEIRRLLERAIDELPQNFRAVFVLRAIEEFSVEETAACLDIPKDTVKTRFHRAKQALRRALDRQVESILLEAFPFAGRRCDRIVASVLERLDLPAKPDRQS